eukprot:Opistho-2@34174
MQELALTAGLLSRSERSRSLLKHFGGIGVDDALLLGDRLPGALNETPIDERIVHKRLQDGHERVFVLTQNAHHRLACHAIIALNSAHFHRIDEHTRETERDALGKFFAVHCHLETIAEVDVQDFPREAVEHKVGGMAVPKSKNIADHRHDGQGARVVCPAVQPALRVDAFEPKHLVQVLPSRVVQGVTKHLNFLDEREVVVVRRHLQHEAVLNVQQDLPALAVVADKRMECVAVWDPANQATVGRQRNHRVPLDAQVALERLRVRSKQRVHKPKQLHHTLILPQVLVPLEQVHIVQAVASFHR